MQIRAFFDADTSTLTYVAYDSDTRDAVIIDPVLDYDPKSSQTDTRAVDEVAQFVEDEQLRVHYVLETHAHADHLSASQLLRQRFDAKVAIGARITEVQETFRELFDLGDELAVDGSQFDVLLDDGQHLRAGSLDIETIATPGHTPACVSYRIGDDVFTGDALFMPDYGVGRCDFPRGSAEALYDSVRGRLYTLPDDTRVYVGHDYQPGGREVEYRTTIGNSKRYNVQLSERTEKSEFVSRRQARDRELPAPRLLLPSVQINANAGRMPSRHSNGRRYLRIPINAFRDADDVGRPL